MGRCYNSVTVNATSDQVWDAIKDFHDMSWASGVITKLEKVGESDGSTPGAKRILNDAFHETLLSVDGEQKLFTYSIDDGPEPVSKDSVQSYVGTVKVYPVTDENTAFVEWQSNYESPDDQAVGEFCNPIYHALLSALKKHL
ncbi:MAG: SRPBCC family protein [Verrucomicrobia bacterium]|nr:SRPBCC family protein [Verrucomicrobiota bacterium]